VIIALVAGEGIASGLIPLAGGFAVQVMLANQRLLNFNGALLVDLPWRLPWVVTAALLCTDVREEAREEVTLKCALGAGFRVVLRAAAIGEVHSRAEASRAVGTTLVVKKVVENINTHLTGDKRIPVTNADSTARRG
jgi:hypothetical protein